MLLVKTAKRVRNSVKGLTFIELIIVIAIIAILSTIALPSYMGYSRTAKEMVCSVNRVQLDRMYKAFLSLNNMKHSEGSYLDFEKEYGSFTCPSGGTIRYMDGEVQCDEHCENDSEDDDDDGGGVPFF